MLIYSLFKMLRFLIAICFLTNLIDNKAGLKVTVNQEVMKNAALKYVPQLTKELKDFVIPNQTLSVDVGFGTLYINLERIHFTVNEVPQNKISASIENNLLFLGSEGIKGFGNLHMNLK